MEYDKTLDNQYFKAKMDLTDYLRRSAHPVMHKGGKPTNTKIIVLEAVSHLQYKTGHRNDTGRCDPSQGRLAVLLPCSKRTVERAFADIKDNPDLGITLYQLTAYGPHMHYLWDFSGITEVEGLPPAWDGGNSYTVKDIPLAESNALMADKASQGALNVVPLIAANDEAAALRSKVKSYERNENDFDATNDIRAIKKFWEARDVSTKQRIELMDQMIKHKGNLRMSVDSIVDLALKEGNEHWRSIHFNKFVAPKCDLSEGAI